MKTLTMEEMRELRADMAQLDLPEAAQDEIIRLLDNIVISIIDQEFGWSPVQISLSARANRAFSRPDSCGGVLASGTFEQVDAEANGVAKPERSADQFTP